MLQKVSLFRNSSTVNRNRQTVYHLNNILNNYKTRSNIKFDLKKTANIEFYQKLVERYNASNYYLKSEEREDIGLIDKIYKNLQNPVVGDFDVLNIKAFSLDNLNLIFAKKKENPKTIDFVLNFHRDITRKYPDSNNQLVIASLKSENSNEYINNYRLYKPFFQVNRQNANSINKLDSMVNNQTYDFHEQSKLAELDKVSFIKKIDPNSKLHFNNLFDIYNQSGNEVIKEFDYYYLNYSYPPTSEAILDIYKTSSPQNVEIRKSLLEHLSKRINVFKMNDYDQFQLINSYKKLFNKIDEDKHAYNFVKKLSTTGDVRNVEKINEILENIPSFKLDVFANNAINIIGQVDRKDVVKVLNEKITKAYYETENNKYIRRNCEKYGLRRSKSYVAKLLQKALNEINVLYYKTKLKLDPSLEAVKPLSIKVVIPDTKAVEKQAIEKKAVEIKPVEKGVVEIKAADTKPVEREIVKIETVEPPIIEKNLKSYIKPEIFVKKQNVEKTVPEIIEQVKTKAEIRKEKKALTIQQVSSIIKNKLGPKMYAKQQNDFSLYANNIRLRFLPEIFNSVAETRKVDRSVGKLKSDSSNKDVLELYTLINGNNKKLVNYLLKKRNVDNTRVFEIKNIIEILKKAEARIAKNKSNNPNYKAKDARAYYNHLYEAKIQEYGKLKNIKNKSSVKYK